MLTVSLDDKYTATSGKIFLSGIQGGFISVACRRWCA